MALSRRFGHKQGMSYALHSLGTMTLHQAEDAAADAALVEALALFQELENKQGVADCLTGLAGSPRRAGSRRRPHARLR